MDTTFMSDVTDLDWTSAQNFKPVQGHAYVKIRKLNKKFGPFYAVKDFSLDIQQDRITCIVGPPNGGKSQIAAILGGFARPTSGLVEIYGRDLVRDIEKLRKTLGYVPE